MFLPVGKLCGRVAEVISNRLYLCSFYNHPESDSKTWYYCVDNDVHYDSFNCDFGPLNLSVLYRFCMKLKEKLKNLEQKKTIVVYSGPTDEARANTAYLIGAYCIIYLAMSAEVAYQLVHRAEPCGFIGFRDAAMGAQTYRLHLHNVLKGVEKAVKFNWLRFDEFDPEEYEFYEKVQNGDLNWIIPNKVLSFCGPHNKSAVENEYVHHSPEVYFEYFKDHGITTIIRLNKRMYDAKRFTKAGFDHIDLFFMDGSTPSDDIIEKFINVVDNARGAVAVHCKAGLGRTGTLIGCWLMKEYGLTAAESMAWLRICRPGSVIGSQQQFLIRKQPWCWAIGSSKVSKISPLCRITSKVDEMKLADTNENKVFESLAVHNEEVPAINEECIVDEFGRTQGDRLLAMKVKAQSHFINKHPSQVTPVKPISLQNKLASEHSSHVSLCRVHPSAPIVSVMSMCPSHLSSKSKSARRLSELRSKPYPHSSIKVQMTPAVFGLRSQADNAFEVKNNKEEDSCIEVQAYAI